MVVTIAVIALDVLAVAKVVAVVVATPVEITKAAVMSISCHCSSGGGGGRQVGR